MGTPSTIGTQLKLQGRTLFLARLAWIALVVLTGELPFKHNHPGAILMAHMTQPPPDPRETVPNLPDGAAYAIRRARAKNLHERYATACEFAGDLSQNENQGCRYPPLT